MATEKQIARASKKLAIALEKAREAQATLAGMLTPAEEPEEKAPAKRGPKPKAKEEAVPAKKTATKKAAIPEEKAAPAKRGPKPKAKEEAAPAKKSKKTAGFPD